MGFPGRSLLLGALFVLALVPSSLGQAQVGSVVGRVQVVRGDFPNHPILVELQLHGATMSSSYCDDEGRFGFYGLSSNLYRVIIRDDAFNPVDEEANLNLLISGQVMVMVRLVPKQSAKSETLTGRAGGSNPYLVDPKEYNRRFPKNVVKEFNKGVDADQHGKREDAIAHYQTALTLSPDYYPAHNNLGSDYLSKGDLTGAREQFEEAIRLNQNDAQAYLNLGNVLLLSGQYADAERALQEEAKRRPDSAFGQFLFGSLYSRTGRPADAERSLREALQIDPTMSEAHLQLVNLYLQQKRTPDAIAELQSYLKTFPDAPYAPRAREMLKKLADRGPVPSPAQ